MMQKLTAIVITACLVAPSWANQQGSHQEQPTQQNDPPPSDPVTWALFDSECRREGATFEVPCGDYGTFQLIEVDPADSCAVLVEGDEISPVYGEPASPGNVTFNPVDPDIVLYEGLHHAMAGADPSRQPQLPGGTSLEIPDYANEAAYAFGLSTGAEVLPGTPPISPALPAEWLGVIDFSGAHAISVSWLADAVSGLAVPTYLGLLNDPALEPLGESVGDFHVLTKLCQLADFVDNGGPPPRVMNMSFGRTARDVDTDTQTDGSGCDSTLAACQIAGVIDHLSGQGVTFVAAAGNHQQMLFPASLDNVVSTGMIDLNRFLEEGVVEGAWETPTDVDALMKGNALCLRHWAAPAGASYSAAVLSGWIYDVLRLHPEIQTTGETIRWAPAYSAEDECYKLSDGRSQFGGCNPMIEELFSGLLGANEQACWTVAELPMLELPAPGAPQSGPQLPSLDQWSEETLPTPESDPCLPCVGFTYGNDLVIDFSSSVGLPTGVFLDEVSLRVGSNYYPLPLTAAELQSIETGSLSTLHLTGWGWLTGLGEKISLSYKQKVNAASSCFVPGNCYWTSTNLFLK